MLAERSANGSGTGIRQRPGSNCSGVSSARKGCCGSSGSGRCTRPPRSMWYLVAAGTYREEVSPATRRDDDYGVVTRPNVAPAASLALNLVVGLCDGDCALCRCDSLPQRLNMRLGGSNLRLGVVASNGFTDDRGKQRSTNAKDAPEHCSPKQMLADRWPNGDYTAGQVLLHNNDLLVDEWCGPPA